MSAYDGLADYVEHFRERVLQDALNEATASYWARRAEMFENARHRPGIDYPGLATIDELRVAWCELSETAQACRNRATVSLMQDGNDTEVDVLGEAS